MNKQPDQLTLLERRGLGLAQLIVSYSPNSAWANQSPSMYAVMLMQVRNLMRGADIEPHTNIRCWFWQIVAYMSGEDLSERIEGYAAQSSPVLSPEGSWKHPITDETLSDEEFRELWRN